MRIKFAQITNFRALKSIQVSLSNFSVLIGENDVGKTSFLHALDKFFAGKKLDEADDWYGKNTADPIRIVVTFDGLPNDAELDKYKWSDGSITISKTFGFDEKPEVRAILEDKSPSVIPTPIIAKYFAADSFHFIPVRRDLAIQFSMNKTALLGKLLRARMLQALESADAKISIGQVEQLLRDCLKEPEDQLQFFVREQLNKPSMMFEFGQVEIDPTEGVSFVPRFSDDGAQDIQIQNRGTGTQNNLIIALFRLIVASNVGNSFVFAMEEPENSLHPKAQRQLLSVIQQISQKTQVIVTTHSPVFIDRSKYESNILLTRTHDGSTSAKVFEPADIADVRGELGIRASDALLKGGGNCAVLVEGPTEEDGFPVFMEMLGMSEFELGIAIINMGGCDKDKVTRIVKLLKAYDIPCVVVLDRDAKDTADELRRVMPTTLSNLKEVFVLSKGMIEDYYPLDIVAQVINAEYTPATPITPQEFDATLSGKARLSNIRKVMFDHGMEIAESYIKRSLGNIGTRLIRDQKRALDPDLETVFRTVETVANR